MIIDTNVKIGKKTCTNVIYLDKILESMDRNGIDKAVISSYPHYIDNAYVKRCFTAYPQRFYGFFMADPWQHSKRLFQNAITSGFYGLVLDPIAHGYGLDDIALLHPFLSICEANHLPVWINTFSSFFSVCTLVKELAQGYPHAVFILGHMGFNYDASTACELAADFPNVYLETSGAMAINLQRANTCCGAKKILLGSGFPDINYQNLAIESIKDIFTASQLEKILYTNFDTLMKEVAVCRSIC